MNEYKHLFSENGVFDNKCVLTCKYHLYKELYIFPDPFFSPKETIICDIVNM